MADYIEREKAEIIFRDARLALKPEGCKDWNEYITRDMMLLNAEQAIHIIPAADVVTWEALQKTWKIANHDVAPVRHGRWITKPYMMGNTQYCSVCGENYGRQHNYCPNCGAKMDGGGKENE